MSPAPSTEESAADITAQSGVGRPVGGRLARTLVLGSSVVAALLMLAAVFSVPRPKAETAAILALGLIALASALRARFDVALKWPALAWLAAALALRAYFRSHTVTLGYGVEILEASVRGAAVFHFGLLLGLALQRWLSIAKTMLAVGSVAVALWAIDLAAIHGSLQPADEALRETKWIGQGWHHARHATMGLVHEPWGWMKAYYPSDPRGYFETELPGPAVDMRCWRIEASAGCQVDVARPDDPRGVLALGIEASSPDAAAPSVENFSAFELQPDAEHMLKFRARADGPQQIHWRCDVGEPPCTKLATGTVALSNEWTTHRATFRAPQSPPKPHGLRFTLTRPGERVEISDVEISVSGAAPQAQPVRHAVTYLLNSQGHRDREHSLETPPNTTRIAVLGDSYVLGYGVHAGDTITARLEDRLNPASGQKSQRTGPRYEVFNFGSIGFCARQERACYEARAAQYRPRIVILALIENDAISMEEEQELGSHFLWQKMQSASPLVREAYRRRMDEITALREQYEKCLPEVRQLHARCQADGARLLVVIYRNHDEENWARFARTITEGLHDDGVAILDLHDAFRAEHTFEELTVHPIDAHPNAAAHGIAAREIERFLVEQGWLVE